MLSKYFPLNDTQIYYIHIYPQAPHNHPRTQQIKKNNQSTQHIRQRNAQNIYIPHIYLELKNHQFWKSVGIYYTTASKSNPKHNTCFTNPLNKSTKIPANDKLFVFLFVETFCY